MPHYMSSMADHRDNSKSAGQRGRKITQRKGSSPTHRSNKGGVLCSSPPGRVFYRQDAFIDTQTFSAANIVNAGWLESLNGAQSIGCSGLSPPKVTSSDKTKSGAGIRHAPAPAFLPQPPKHWMCGTDFEEEQVVDICIDSPQDVGSAISNQLKMLLKVQG